MEKRCSNYGSIYRLEYTSLNWRDKDSIDCEVCGSVLHRWNEAKAWEAELIGKTERNQDDQNN